MALTAQDRCDRCMAQAYWSADSLDWPATLLFCLHHYAEHAAVLLSAGAILVDHRDEKAKTW